MHDKAFNKDALRKISEQHLARTILVTDIYEFLLNHSKLNATQIPQVLTERAGKSRNSFYKDRNHFTNYTASSFFRYWRAMLNICYEQNLDQSLIPSLDDLLEKYNPFIDFISHIAIEDDLNILINNNLDSVWSIYVTYRIENTKPGLLTSSEEILLNEIEQHPMIQLKLTEKKYDQLERMKKK